MALSGLLHRRKSLTGLIPIKVSPTPMRTDSLEKSPSECQEVRSEDHNSIAARNAAIFSVSFEDVKTLLPGGFIIKDEEEDTGRDGEEDEVTCTIFGPAA